MHYCYQVFGLIVKSEMQFPELLTIPQQLENVNIVFGLVPDKIQDPLITGVVFQAKENQFLLNIKDVARYLVEGGEKITVQIFNQSESGMIRSFLLGSAFGALLYQRNYLLLHGSAIDTDGGAIIFCGESGAGKSTLAASFDKLGFKIISDDLCAIQFDENKNLVLYPAYPQIKLWEDAIQKIHVEKDDNFHQISSDRFKFAVRKKENFQNEPRPIKKIFMLGTHNKDVFDLQHMTGIQKIRLLQKESYRQRFLKGLNKEVNRFQLVSQMANQVDLFRVIRPRAGYQLDELVQLIKAEINK